MRRIVIGIDPSSKKIAMVVTLPGADPMVRKFDLAKRGGDPVACRRAYFHVTNLISDATAQCPGVPICAYIEAPLVGRGGIRTTMVQSFVNGAIQAALSAHTDQVNLVHPSTWKAKIVGNGRASKDECAGYLRGVWPSLADEIAGDEDLTDAACINIFGSRDSASYTVKPQKRKARRATPPSQRKAARRRVA